MREKSSTETSCVQRQYMLEQFLKKKNNNNDNNNNNNNNKVVALNLPYISKI